jgi:3-hydroxyisobutyrate dehydrogenase-like beta-hydroxyacid dehydrogenase
MVLEDSDMDYKVGFMGLGIMGSAMATNIAKAGYPVMVYNRTPDKSSALAGRGVEVAPSPKVLARDTDVIVAMVTGPEALEELLWGAEGAAQELNDRKTFVNMSTVSPRFTRELQQKLAPLDVAFIDAPVSGSKKPAQEGTLLILAGGDRQRVEALTPLFNTMGKKVIYCGESGQGSMMKMVVNLLLGVMMEGFCEALNFGKLGGLTMEAMLDTILSGPLNCALYQMKLDMIAQDDFPASFPLQHMTKDFKFVLDTALETGASVPAAHTALQLYRLAVGKQWGELDFAAVHRAIQLMSESK